MQQLCSKSPRHVRSPALRRGWAYHVTCGLLAIGTVVLFYLSWQQMRLADAPTGENGSRAVDSSRDASSPRVDAEDEGLGLLELAPTVDHFTDAVLAGFDPAIEPLEHEPAGLEPPEGGRRQWAFARDVGGRAEEAAVWLVEAQSAERLAAFYTGQARGRGFEPLPPGDSADAPNVRLLSFVAPGPPMRVLTVRLSERGEAVHVLIALR